MLGTSVFFAGVELTLTDSASASASASDSHESILKLDDDEDPEEFLLLSDVECLNLTSQGSFSLYSCTDHRHLPRGILTISLPFLRRQRISRVACSANALIAVTSEFKYFSVGFGTDASDQFRLHSSVPPRPCLKISVAQSHGLFLVGDSIFGIGSSSCGQIGFLSKKVLEEPVKVELHGGPWIDVACGMDFSLVTSKDYTYSFGSGCYCRLGQGDTEIRISPTLVEGLQGCGSVQALAAGTWHCVVVMAGSNEVFAWGWNKWGQIGGIDTACCVAFPCRVCGLPDEKLLSVSAGSRHTALLYEGGQVLVLGVLGSQKKRNREGDGDHQLISGDYRSIASHGWGLVLLK